MSNPLAPIRRTEGQRLHGDMAIAMSPEQLQGWLDRWCGQLHDTVHASLGCTPNEKLANYARDGWQPRMVGDTAILDWLLLEDAQVTLQRHGIRIQNRLYIAPELGAIEVGTKLSARFDADNPNEIQVFRGEEFVCLAKWRDALSPAELAELAGKAKAASKVIDQHINAVSRKGKQLKKKLAKNPEILHEESAPMLRRQLAELPGAGQAEQAIKAIANPKQQSAAEQAERDVQWQALVAKREAESAPSEIVVRSPHDWLHWWDNPEQATVEDLRWMKRTANMPGYGQAWLLMRRLDLDEVLETLDRWIEKWAA